MIAKPREHEGVRARASCLVTILREAARASSGHVTTPVRSSGRSGRRGACEGVGRGGGEGKGCVACTCKSGVVVCGSAPEWREVGAKGGDGR